MTVRMLVSFNGYFEGQIVNLGGVEEARLIGLGFASADQNGPASDESIAKIKSDPVTGVGVLFGGDGLDVVSTLQQLIVAPLDADMFGFSVNSARKLLTLPTPYTAEGLEMVHPCVINFPTGWMGYKYWMCATPYPGANSAYENPCIFVSNDKINWIVPTGLQNPLVPKPTPATSYNADNFIFFRDNLLYLVYRERSPENAWNRLILMSSANGVAWSSPVEILRGAYSIQDYGSPSIWHDGSQFVMIAHNLDAGGFPVQRYVSPSLLSGWSVPSTVTIPHPSAGTWWHSEFRRISATKIIGVLQDGNSAGGALYFAESFDNGITFASKKMTIDAGYYKTGFTLSTNENPSLSLFVGRISGGFFTYTEEWVNTPAPIVTRAAIAEHKDFGTAPGLVCFDTFNRADSAVSVGVADFGPGYTLTTGTMGISTNRAYGVTTGNNRVVIAAGSADHYAQAKVASFGNANLWIFARGVDGNNYWRLGSGSGNTTTVLFLQSIVAGSVNESIEIPGGRFVDGGVYGIRAVGSIISIFQNGYLLAEYQRTAHATGAQCGFQASGTVLSYLDNFTVIAA